MHLTMATFWLSLLCAKEPNAPVIAFVWDLFGITLANSAEPPTSTSLNKKIGTQLCWQGRMNLPLLRNHHTSIGLQMLPHKHLSKVHFKIYNYFERAVSRNNNCHNIHLMLTDIHIRHPKLSCQSQNKNNTSNLCKASRLYGICYDLNNAWLKQEVSNL